MSEDQPIQILERLRNDDRQALRLLFEKHYQSVCGTVRRYVREQSSVEDIAQNVFLKIWEKRHTIQVKTSFGAYLHRMAVNEAISFWRKQQRQQLHQNTFLTVAPNNTVSTEEQYLHLELDQRIRQAINDLPPRCQLIFKLSRFEELSYREIAEKLDLSIKTVENQMGKALRILRKKFKR